MKKIICKSALLLAAIFGTGTKSAFAYVDPGFTGSTYRLVYFLIFTAV